jgi:hypothetical protein
VPAPFASARSQAKKKKKIEERVGEEKGGDERRGRISEARRGGKICGDDTPDNLNGQ